MTPSLTAVNGANGHSHLVSKKPHVHGFGTRAIHVGSEPNEQTGAVIPSISLSTTFKQDGIGIHKVCTETLFLSLSAKVPPQPEKKKMLM